MAVLDSAGRALLELPLKGLGALPQAKLGQYLGDIEGLLSGELSPEALAKLAGKYDEADVRGRSGELPDETLIAGDHRAAEAVRNAYAAALAHPGQRAEIARDLLQVLIERDSDLDLEELAIETALEFLPGKGLYDLGADAVQMARAIDESDWSALATLGGVALLDAIGSVPGVGPLAERGLRRLARGVGLLKSAGREAAERIATLARVGGKEANALKGAAEKELKKAEGETGELDGRSINADETELLAGKGGTSQGALRSPSHAEAAQLAKNAEDYLVKLYGWGGSLSNPQYLDGFIEKMHLPPEKAALLREIFSRDIIPGAAEREVSDALATFADGTGFRVWDTKKSVRAERLDGNAYPDIALRPADMSDEEFGVFVKDVVSSIDKRPFAFFEVKTGKAALRTPQRKLLEKLIAEGKGDIFVLYNLPQSKIRPEFLAQSAEKYLFSKGTRLSAESQELVLHLAQELQISLPRSLSAGEAFLYMLIATATAVGLSSAFDQVQE